MSNTNCAIILFFTLVCLTNYHLVTSRNITKQLNPGCNDQCKQDKSATNVVYLRSEGDVETTHFFWCTIMGVPPTIIMAQTEKSSTLKPIDWKSLLDPKASVSNAIQFTSPPFNSLGIELKRFYFFDDIHKKGSFQPDYYGNHTASVKWSQLMWANVNASFKDESVGNSFSVKFTQEDNKYLNNGTIDITLSMSKSDGRGDDLPHLAFTPLSTSLQIDFKKVLLDKMKEDKKLGKEGFKNARLMADLTIVSYSSSGSSFEKIDKITSIDDEYTPGVFDRLILNMKSKNESHSSFMEWKPVAYFQSEKIIANTLDVENNDLENLNETIPKESRLLTAFYGGMKGIHVGNFTFTFGSSEDTDRYYGDSKYNTYAFVAGLGSPPEQKLSSLVQMIILVGFGLPLLVMVVSAIYLIVRKIRKRSQDDLLLNQANSQTR